ncbi:MAG TPA: monovalent cation/H(+) antiporter subunit G [Phototrophicaceae bacterium]|jgi:multicomponent Na+:H+ antiporter subunit G|nr:monovalent cation/H(+) antiporter subunit G [Phototrophicaceae bacterium]
MEILGVLALWGGVFFCAVGVIGLVRMPDVYCRLHASGKVATVGLCGLVVAGAFLLPGVILKLVALAIFAVLTLPVSTHAIAAAAYHHGVEMQEPVRDDLAEQIEFAPQATLRQEYPAA